MPSLRFCISIVARCVLNIFYIFLRDLYINVGELAPAVMC